MQFKSKDLLTIGKNAGKAWVARDPFRQSAVIAYYAVFSLPALLVVIITVAGFFFGADAVNKHIFNQVADTMGAETSSQVEDMIEHASESKKSVWAAIIGVVVLLFGATGVFVQLQATLNMIWEVKPSTRKSGIWHTLRTRLFSFGLVLAIAFLLLISLVVSTALAAFSDWLSADRSEALAVLFHVIDFLISLAVISALFALMFKFLPDARISWRDVLVGSLLTGLLFMIGKTLIAFYFGKAEPGSGYGAAGSIVLILLWVSYSSMIVFFGAEFTRAWVKHYRGEIRPASYAEKDPAADRPKAA
jgi:membrane protein